MKRQGSECKIASHGAKFRFLLKTLKHHHLLNFCHFIDHRLRSLPEVEEHPLDKIWLVFSLLHRLSEEKLFLKSSVFELTLKLFCRDLSALSTTLLVFLGEDDLLLLLSCEEFSLSLRCCDSCTLCLLESSGFSDVKTFGCNT